MIPNVSAMVPKGKYTVAFCNTCFYLDSTSKQIRVDYNKYIRFNVFICSVVSVLNAGVLDMKDVMNVVLALKKPLEVLFWDKSNRLDRKEEILMSLPSTR